MLTFALLSWGALASAEQTYDLTVNFQPGSTYHYVQNSVIGMEMNNPVSDGKIKMDGGMEMDFLYRASEHEKGVKVDMEIERFAMHTSSNGVQMMSYNSAEPSETPSPLAGAIKPLLEMRCYAIYDSKGQALEFGGMDESLAQAAQLGMDKEMFEKMFSDLTDMAPQDSVSIGDKWSYSSKVPMGQMGAPIEMLIDCELQKVEQVKGRTLATVAYVADLSAASDADSETPLKVTTHQFEGVYLYDFELATVYKNSLSARMTIGAAGGVSDSPNGIGEIPYTMTMVQELKKVTK